MVLFTDFDELDADDTEDGAATQFANSAGAGPTSGWMGLLDDLLAGVFERPAQAAAVAPGGLVDPAAGAFRASHLSSPSPGPHSRFRC